MLARMDTNVNGHPCQCELCQPNWFLGSGGDFVPQPVMQVTRDEALTRKLYEQPKQKDFAPVSG